MNLQFRSITQGDNEVATSYFNRISRETKRDCYHTGINLSPINLLSRAIRGANTHHLYDTTYKSYERKQDDFRTNRSNPEPTFIQLETSLARIMDERREKTIPGQQRRYPNHQANAATMRHMHGSLSNRPSNQHRPFVRRNNESQARYSSQNSSSCIKKCGIEQH
jgi:hypothetical protein